MSEYIANEHAARNSEAIAELEARLAEIEAGIHDPYAFTSRIFTQATFPHSSKVGDKVVLVNGKMTVTMMSTENGLPYGVYPRLIMCWLTREALRRKHLPIDEARRISLGSSFRHFTDELGISGSGAGKNGVRTKLKEQLIRLFSTVITVKVENDGQDDDQLLPFTGLKNTLIADEAEMWWDKKSPDQFLQDSTVVLSARFFREISGSAVPIDTRILTNLKRSPLAIDLYCWITFRLSYLTTITVVTWDQLRRQIGASYPDTPQGKRDWKKKVIAAHQKVCDAWKETLGHDVTVYAVENGLMLAPGATSVPKRVMDESPITPPPF